jgi:hypothetical protein
LIILILSTIGALRADTIRIGNVGLIAVDALLDGAVKVGARVADSWKGVGAALVN